MGITLLVTRPQVLGLRHPHFRALLKPVAVSASPGANQQATAKPDTASQAPNTPDYDTVQGLPGTPPEQYPFSPPPVMQASPGLPAWVWIMVGVLLASVFGKVMNFVRQPRAALTEMMFKQMADSMKNQQGMGGQQNPFFPPGGGFGGMPGAGSPPVDTYASPVKPDAAGTAYSAPGPVTPTGGQVPAQPQQTASASVEAQSATSSATPSAFDPAGLGSATAPKGYSAGGAATAPGMASSQGPAPQGTGAGGGFFSDVRPAPDKAETANDDDIDWLFNLLKDPQMRDSLYPFLPEQMRDPQMLETVFANPVVKEQLKTMFTPDMMAKMREFQGSVNDPQLKQQLEGMNISPDVLMQKLMQEPELMALLQKPNVMEAVMDMNKNPESMTKYMNDPEVMKVMMKMSELTMQAQGQAPAPPQGQGFQQPTQFTPQPPPQQPFQITPQAPSPPPPPMPPITSEQPSQQAPPSAAGQNAATEDQKTAPAAVSPSDTDGTGVQDVEPMPPPQEAQAGTSSGQ